MKSLTCLFYDKVNGRFLLVTLISLCHSDVIAADVDHFKDTNGSILQFSSTRKGTVQGKNLLIAVQFST